jgi:hippurate hydrolase
MMASSDTLHIEVKGVGGHGAVPEHTVDATLVACHITLALQSIVSRNITPFEPAVVTVGSIQAGHAPNIINDKVLMKLTVRTERAGAGNDPAAHSRYCRCPGGKL